MEVVDIPTKDLKHYKLNRKHHPKEQIERLAKLIESHGFRDPLIVDKDSMEVICGNGTLQACKKLKMESIPCILQTFQSEEQKYAFSVSHNSIQEWTTVDLSAIHHDLPTLEGFDIDLLGIKNFQFEPITPMDEIPESPSKLEMITCPSCDAKFEKSQGKSTIL